MKYLTELQCAEQLNELAEVIEQNGYNHLIKQLEVVRDIEKTRLKELNEKSEEVNKLTSELTHLKESIHAIKIKSMAIADLNSALKTLTDAAAS